MCKKIKCSDNSLDEVPEVAALSRGYATFSGIQCWLRRSITVLGVTCAGAGNMTLGRGIIFILSVFTTVPILGLWSSRRVGQQHSCRALSLRLRRRRRPKDSLANWRYATGCRDRSFLMASMLPSPMNWRLRSEFFV